MGKKAPNPNVFGFELFIDRQTHVLAQTNKRAQNSSKNGLESSKMCFRRFKNGLLKGSKCFLEGSKMGLRAFKNGVLKVQRM